MSPEQVESMRRIAVIGNAGAGKSTLSRELGPLLGLPVTHLDLLLWRPGWRAAPAHEFEAGHCAVLAGERWLIDGLGPPASLAERLEWADTIIFPDYALPRLYLGAARRQLTSLFRPRPDFPGDCPQWPKTLALFRMMGQLHWEVRPDLLALAGRQRPRAAVYHFRSPSETRRFVEEVRGALNSGGPYSPDSLPSTSSGSRAGR